MEVIECVFERRIREKVKINTIQFEFQGKSSLYDRCRRNMEVKQRSSTLLCILGKSI